MPFTVKDWKNLPDQTTPIDAAALESMETRLSNYTDSRVDQFVRHIEDEGAVAGTDSRAAIQAAIDSASAAGGGVVVGTPGKSYRLTNGLGVALPSNVILRNLSLDLSNWTGTPTNPAIAAAGTLGTAINLTANAVEGATTLTAASWTGIAIGDWIKISATNVFGATNQPVGEIQRVRNIVGTTLTLGKQIRGDYTTANTAQVQKVTMVDNVGLDAVFILGPTDTAVAVQGFVPTLCWNLYVRGSTFRRTQRSGMDFVDVVDSRVAKCHFQDNELTGFAYGMTLNWACENVQVTGITGRRLRHLLSVGGGVGYKGITRNIQVTGALGTEITDAMLDCHAAGEQINWDNCHVDGSDQDGFAFMGATGSINNCSARNVARHGLLYRPSTNRPHELEAKNFRVYRAGDRGVAIEPQATFENWKRLDLEVSVDTCTSHGIELNNTQTTRYENINISYSARNVGGQGLRLVKCGRIKVTPRNVYESANSTYGAIFENCQNAELAGGVFGVIGAPTSTRAVGVFTTCDRINIHDISSTGGEYGIWLDDGSTNCRVHDNDVSGATSEAIHPGTGTTNVFHHNKPAGEGSVQTVATDAAFTLTPHSSPEHTLHTGTLTAGRAVTLSTTNAYPGQKFKVSRSGGGAFNLTVGAKALATGQWSEHTYIGGAWVLTSFGSL